MDGFRARHVLYVLCILALIFLAWENYDLWWKPVERIVNSNEEFRYRNPIYYHVTREDPSEDERFTGWDNISTCSSYTRYGKEVDLRKVIKMSGGKFHGEE